VPLAALFSRNRRPGQTAWRTTRHSTGSSCHRGAPQKCRFTCVRDCRDRVLRQGRLGGSAPESRLLGTRSPASYPMTARGVLRRSVVAFESAPDRRQRSDRRVKSNLFSETKRGVAARCSAASRRSASFRRAWGRTYSAGGPLRAPATKTAVRALRHQGGNIMLEIGLFHNGASSLPIVTGKDGVTF